MDLKIKIRIVLLMARFNSPTQVIRELKKEGYPYEPSRQGIYDIYNRFCETGSVLDSNRSGRPKISDEESTSPITEILQDNPKSTLTEISSATGVSRATISRRIKNDIGMFPYKIQIHQELQEYDFDRRVEMAEVLLPVLRNKAYEDLIFYSDEATFYLSGRVHKQNCRIWDYENPHEFQQEPLHSEKVNVWCAMSSRWIIGPYFFEEATINGENYLKMLKEYFRPILGRKHIQNKVYFQQDGAPVHYAVEVREWLNLTFPGKWIGRRGPIEWAPRSPDLTPCDFFLWGYLKQKVFSEPLKNLAELRQRITDHVQLIEMSTLKKCFLNIEKRLELVLENGGAHIEHLI